MSNFNKTILVGNLTSNPDMKDFSNGGKVTNFAIALNRDYIGHDGEKVEEVSYIDCIAYGKRAEVINKYFTKGRKILVEGRMKQERWVDKESNKNQSRIRVVVEHFEFMDNKKNNCECSTSECIPAEAGNDVNNSEVDDFNAI